MSGPALRAALPTVALVVTTALVIVLSLRVRATEQDLREMSVMARSLPIGSYVPIVTVPDVTGDSVSIGPTGSTQVLLFFTTSCRFCEASIEAWLELVRGARDLPGVKVLAISLDSVTATTPFLRSNDLDITTALFLEPRVRSFYRVTSVPRTVVIDGSGRALYSRSAVFTMAAADSVLRALRAWSAQESQPATEIGQQPYSPRQ